MKKILSILAAVSLAAAMAGCSGSITTSTTSEAESDMQYLQDKGSMTIGYTLFKPMNYMEDNELTGFETEFAKLVCDKLGVEPDFQEIDWDSKEMELNSKNIDCIWNGMTITEERKNNMSITNPYMGNRQVMIVKAENVDKYTKSVDGAKVIAETGSTGEELAQEDEFFANADFTAVDSQAKGLMDVASGTSDVVIVDYVLSTGSIGEGTDYTDLVMIDKGFDPQEYGVAFRKGSDVTEKVNKAMEELAKDGSLEKLAEKYNLQDLLMLK